MAKQNVIESSTDNKTKLNLKYLTYNINKYFH